VSELTTAKASKPSDATAYPSHASFSRSFFFDKTKPGQLLDFEVTRISNTTTKFLSAFASASQVGYHARAQRHTA
jgi:hypothetical protein